MRGDDPSQGAAFSYVTPEQRVPSDHPLRLIREMTNEVLHCCLVGSRSCTRGWAGRRLRPGASPARSSLAVALQHPQ